MDVEDLNLDTLTLIPTNMVLKPGLTTLTWVEKMDKYLLVTIKMKTLYSSTKEMDKMMDTIEFLVVMYLKSRKDCRNNLCQLVLLLETFSSNSIRKVLLFLVINVELLLIILFWWLVFMMLKEKLLTGLYRTVGELPGEIMDSEELLLLKVMVFAESIWLLNNPYLSIRKTETKFLNERVIFIWVLTKF